MQCFSLYLLLFSFWFEQAGNFKFAVIKGFSLTNIAIMFVASCWLVYYNRVNSNYSYKIKLYLLLFLFISILSIFLRIFIDEFPLHSFYEILVLYKSWLNPYILFILLVGFLDKHSAEKALIALMIFCVCSGIVSLLIAHGLLADISKESIEGRVMGFAEPNQYAAYLVLMIPLLFSYFLIFKIKIYKILTLISIFIVTFALVNSGSRGGYISLIISAIVYIFFGFRNKLFKFSKLLIGLILFLMCLFGSIILSPDDLKSNMYEKMNYNNSKDLSNYTSGRIEIFINGWEMFKERPILGHGFGTFLDLNITRFHMNAVSHNEYLEILVSQGIVGLIVYLLLLFQILKQVFNNIKYSACSTNILINISFISGFIGYCVATLSVNIYEPKKLVWVYIAVVISLANNYKLKNNANLQNN